MEILNSKSNHWSDHTTYFIKEDMVVLQGLTSVTRKVYIMSHSRPVQYNCIFIASSAEALMLKHSEYLFCLIVYMRLELHPQMQEMNWREAVFYGYTYDHFPYSYHTCFALHTVRVSLYCIRTRVYREMYTCLYTYHKPKCTYITWRLSSDVSR